MAGRSNRRSLGAKNMLGMKGNIESGQFLPCELDVIWAKWGRMREKIYFHKTIFFLTRKDDELQFKRSQEFGGIAIQPAFVVNDTDLRCEWQQSQVWPITYPKQDCRGLSGGGGGSWGNSECTFAVRGKNPGMLGSSPYLAATSLDFLTSWTSPHPVPDSLVLV